MSVTLDELCRQVTRLVDASSGRMVSVRVQAGELAVEMRWPEPAAGPPAPPAPAGPPPAPGDPETAEDAEDDTFTITAPLVGTCYLAPEPGAPPFAAVGDAVEEGDQVAIVEAMKLMNPVTAPRPGRVVAFEAADAEPVEYGQPLIRLAPL